jgi:membrane protease YdiL (CAAX protease family)
MRREIVHFVVFIALSVLLLGLVPLIDAMAGGGLMDFAGQAERASAETGVPSTSSLYDMARLAMVEPGLWLLILGSFVPTLAALLVLVILGRGSGLGRFVLRLLPIGPNGASLLRGLGAYGVLIVLCVVALLLAFAIREAVAPGVYVRSLTPDMADAGGLAAAILIASFLDQGAVLEEGGWRGYATPLLYPLMTPLNAAILVGLAWGLWHLPRDLTIGLPETLGLETYLAAYLPSFLLGTVSVSIIAVWGMNRAGGSLWPAIMAHGLANDSMGIAGKVEISQALTPLHQFTGAIPFVIVAVGLVLYSGQRLCSEE